MNWLYNITKFEIVIWVVFLLIYFFFFLRVWLISRHLTRASRLILAKFVLRGLYLSLFTIALLGPSFDSGENQGKTASKDIHLLLDMSASMKATDLPPSRLDKLRIELVNLINNLRTNRFSVMVFSSQSHWQIPLTYDLQLVRDFIESVDPDLLPSSGTNINAPLEAFKDYLRTSGDPPVNDLIVLITDGEFYNEPSPALISELKKAGVRVLIVGVGTTAGASLETTQMPPLSISSLNTQKLEALARELNGKLFYLTDVKNDFPLIIDEINRSRGSLAVSQQKGTESNKYSNFLLAGILLAITDFLIKIKVFKL